MCIYQWHFKVYLCLSAERGSMTHQTRDVTHGNGNPTSWGYEWIWIWYDQYMMRAGSTNNFDVTRKKRGIRPVDAVIVFLAKFRTFVCQKRSFLLEKSLPPLQKSPGFVVDSPWFPSQRRGADARTAYRVVNGHFLAGNGPNRAWGKTAVCKISLVIQYGDWYKSILLYQSLILLGEMIFLKNQLLISLAISYYSHVWCFFLPWDFRDLTIKHGNLPIKSD